MSLKTGVKNALYAGQLAAALRFLQRTFSMVSMDDYLAALTAGKCRNLATLTFDDGLRNQLTVAYEVLADLGVPATFYVCPALVGTELSTWTWELEPRFLRMSRFHRRELLFRASADSFEALLRTMKQMPLHQRESLWQEVVEATPGFAFSPEEDRQFALMSWAELAKLDRSLIAIGSHTQTHVDLPQVSEERMDAELAASQATLREKIGCEARHFAYPNGSYDQRSSSAVARYFDSGVTMDRRAVGRDARPHMLPRVHIQLNIPEFAWILARAARD
jgi:peptidoglycan/xylan/chitin deacetylase (PgdA/CDA1 family)